MKVLSRLFLSLGIFFTSIPLFASEADLNIPTLEGDQRTMLIVGLLICFFGFYFGMHRYRKIKKLKAHRSMLDVGNLIFETCKTYLIQQGKFLIILELFIAICIAFYFGYLKEMHIAGVLLILGWSIIGILGSYSVAWFGIRLNTLANSRTAFASLKKAPLQLHQIPLDSGMSIGMLLVCVELIMMLIIVLWIPREYAGACFIGFAIGESLGASALRIAGGIFTKIADIGSDLMKVFFKIKEDDPRNPGVIADCTGDNAGDSVGPTADGFETYGVTGVALISFIVLGIVIPGDEALTTMFRAELITWIFVMRILMVLTSIAAYRINRLLSQILFGKKDDFDFEKPLTNLIWITSGLSIAVTFVASYFVIGHLPDNLWITLSAIISCGTLGAALIPEFTKIFTSPKSKHVKEVVEASREGGPSLNILSGLLAGNYSAFWLGMIFLALMFVAYFTSSFMPEGLTLYPSIFAFGLVAFGFLGMGPVTIAVDSYGPVTDNAQSIYELSMIEQIPGIEKEIERDFEFTPDFKKAKYFLESNDGAGNTFKATAKPVLIGTAVVGATTMIFSLILLIQNTLNIAPADILNILNPYTMLGFITGGAVIYWFTGASIQAVTTGAYRAVEYIKKNIRLDDGGDKIASTEKSKEVVRICTQYAQKGMFNIFIAIFSFALAFAFLSSPSTGLTAAGTPVNPYPASFFISYLMSIAVFGLFQAVFMANAGGCWDNAKKVVEVNLGEKGTDLHAACVVGDTVGDPFKDTSSVALNPVIKFTTLFGLLAMEISIVPEFRSIAPYIGGVFFIIALVFVWRSFYSMRIRE